jgi:23S rRNA maturation mini-RNase III
MDFLLQAGVLALEHWDSLTEEEQRAFRRLAEASQGDAKLNLNKEEYRELRGIWKKLEVRHLISKGVRLAFRRTPGKRSLR